MASSPGARPAKTLRLKRAESRRLVLVARDVSQPGKLKMTRLSVEAVAVLPHDARHARSEAADDDGRRGIGPQIALGLVESVVRAGKARAIP